MSRTLTSAERLAIDKSFLFAPAHGFVKTLPTRLRLVDLMLSRGSFENDCDGCYGSRSGTRIHIQFNNV